MLSEGAGTPENQIAFGFRTALLRDAQPQEIAVLTQLYQDHLEAARQFPAQVEPG